MSYRKFVKQVMQMGVYYSASLATIHRIQHGMAEAQFEKTLAKLAELEYDVIRKFRNMIKLVNLPTQREVASKCELSLGIVK